MAHVTTDVDEAPIKLLCFTLGVEDVNLLNGVDVYAEESYLVLLNGVILGIHRNQKKFVENFRLLRNVGRVGAFVSIYSSPSMRSINISSDGGRICRPLIIVRKGESLVKDEDLTNIVSGIKAFEDLVSEGKIEYLDVNEEGDRNIAFAESNISFSEVIPKSLNNTTHLEIAPFTILGAVAGLIPYPHHNQSPRNTYQV